MTATILLTLLITGMAGLALDVFDFTDSSSSPDTDEDPSEIDDTEQQDTGTPGDDLLTAGSENQSISGFAGDDTLIGGDGDDDTLRGGPGDDLLIDGEIVNTGRFLPAGPGGAGYILVENRGGGTLHGDAGNDTIFAAQGDAFGGPGDDSLSNFDDILISDDPVAFGRGAIDADRADGRIFESEVHPGNNLFGGPGDDQINVVGGNAFGGDGNDTITGNGSDAREADYLLSFFSQPNFELHGGDGNDLITGESTNIFGGPGDDEIFSRHSRVFGEDGNDTIHASQLSFDGQRLEFDGGPGDDLIVGDYDTSKRVYETGGQVVAEYSGGTGDDVIDARLLADIIEVSGGAGQSRLKFESGCELDSGGFIR